MILAIFHLYKNNQEYDSKKYSEVDIILHREKQNKLESKTINNLIDNVMTNIKSMRYLIEFEYLYKNIKILNEEGTKVTIYWLPKKLNDNFMYFNYDQMSNWWKEGYETAYDETRIEIFEPTNNLI